MDQSEHGELQIHCTKQNMPDMRVYTIRSVYL